jgi:hypothetical protein
VPSAETGSTQKNGVKNTYQSKSVHHYLADFFFFLFSRECTAFFFLAADMRDTVVFFFWCSCGGVTKSSKLNTGSYASQPGVGGFLLLGVKKLNHNAKSPKFFFNQTKNIAIVVVVVVVVSRIEKNEPKSFAKISSFFTLDFVIFSIFLFNLLLLDNI